jgi:hypothetical protein
MIKIAWFFSFTLFLFGAILEGYSQQSEKPQAVFVEGLGSGILYSFNYDTRFSDSPSGWGARAGMGYTSLEGLRMYTLPLVVNHLIGKKKHFLELGAGVTLVRVNDRTNINPHSSFLNVENEVLGTLAIGYRRVSTSGFTLRAGLTPLIGAGIDEFFWPQLSFGFAF